MSETLLSVGVDIGTSTTQIILSEIKFENLASSYTVPRITITDKKIIYKSEIITTPIDKDNLILSEDILKFILKQYKIANIEKEEIETGAVIITGESARRKNAENVDKTLSGYIGDFVVATAGPDLESIIAGKGSGTYQHSIDTHSLIANLDIGGGTTNIVVFKDGKILDTACFDIGGRQIRFNENGEIDYIAPKVKEIIEKEQMSLELGKKPIQKELKKIINIFVDTLDKAVKPGEKGEYHNLLITNKDLNLELYPELEQFSYSGGVADCIGKDVDNIYEYLDIGLLFGDEIKRSETYRENKIIETQETIRATVVGAGSHTMDISGSTIFYDRAAIPIKNIPVVSFTFEEMNKKRELSSIIEEKILWHKSDVINNCALSFTGYNSPTYQEIIDLGNSIIKGSEVIRTKNHPLVVIIENDMAKSLGHYLKSKLKNIHVVCIDNIIATNGDYLDIANPIAKGEVLPVVVKSLVFN